jgi:PAS domain S-box-containing protein
MAMISDEIERISGYPPSDFIGNQSRTFVSIIHPDDRAEVEREVRTATTEDRPFALEYRIVRADGTVAWVLERGQRVAESDDQAWLHGVIFDITERKHAEDVLRRREAEEARIAELKAARARIIAAQDATRRKIERDLHDGAQQRLVTVALALRMIKAELDDDPDAASGLLDEAIATLAEATAELRQLARGIHPAVLTDKGLAVAVAVLAGRAPVPVDVQCSLSERLPGPIEAAAYYVVAESLTNVARYSKATRATIRLARQRGCALVEVEDDGVGGVNPDAGSGIRGLIDRIDALDGSLDVCSEPGKGTRIQVRIPLASNNAGL